MVLEGYKIKIELVQIGVAEGELIRIHSPITIERLVKKLPLTGSGRFFIGSKTLFMIPVGIKKGAERPTNDVKKGDIVYEQSSDSIIICLANEKTRMKVSKIGRITKGLELFSKINRSNGVKISIIN